MVEQNLHKDHPHVQTKRLWKDHKRGWAVIMVLLMFATAAVKDNAQHLQLSVLTIPEHATFDGTVYPVQNVPDWLNTTGDEQDMLFGSFPAEKLLDIPSYDTSRLSVNDLTWGDVEDDYTRVMQNTYPVVYAGTYRLDGIEGIGSHPAVDIKALTGTPTYSIMNGYVERVSYSSYGFGNLVVIRHNNVPSPENSSVGTTLFSGYAHLDSVNVNEGDVVTKGQQIGTIGDTGTATTPHLHFQIDTAAAPWHLYWPFTTAEANAVGGFFEAVNQGVGLDKVYTNTTHPMDYVQNYLDVDTEIILSSVDEASTEEEIIEEEVVEEEDAEDVVIDVETTDVITEEEIVEEVGPVFDHMEFDFNPYMEDGISQLLKISLVDERGEYILSPELEEDIVVTVSDAEILSTTEILTGEDFTKGYVSIEVETVATGLLP
ncbi:M23 family metallopeptidase [Candidatus Peregrinibacteria bacterium]|nr:M23 family metallopeptidase [Candidatus Peregrinibacteria bacterium]